MPYRSYAEFARTKGAKDKGKRKSRAGMIAGGVAGAGALGYGASIPLRAALGKGYSRTDSMDYAGNKSLPLKERVSKIGSRVKNNSRAVLDSDVASVKRGVSRAKDSLGRARQAAMRGSGKTISAGGIKQGTNKGLLPEIVGRTKNVWKSGGAGKAILGGGGLLAAAGGTAAVLNYLKNRKKNKK